MHIYFLLLLSLTTIVKGGFVEDCKAKFVAPKATDDAYNLYCPKSDTCGDGVRPSDLKESSGSKTAEVAGQVLDVIDFASGFVPDGPLKSIADVGKFRKRKSVPPFNLEKFFLEFITILVSYNLQA